MRWRYQLALRLDRGVGLGIEYDPSRFATPILADEENYDRIGPVGRFRDGATWDAATRTFRGGRATPAFRIMLAYGRLAEARFAREGNAGETLQNMVVLPDSTRIPGNRLVRGATAERCAAELLARITRRGVDASHVETGGGPMFVLTAQQEDSDRMFAAALGLLAAAAPGDVAAWQAARYLLYQAPRTKKGSDAVTRTFLVATGAVLFGHAPVLDQDIDLRCMVLGQDAATTAPSDPPV
ncbi:hypothetical protein [Actinophytocola sp.]|uniref:hypothetical protein n=1 Tax=Actinophytocola sp. TaxID=1872138 RepID=UPI002D588BEA|nr:hypothetical protein [Actinophytocola sp.]HYQ64759.1 hypothetical protein [Actinophytocola sp.]